MGYFTFEITWDDTQFLQYFSLNFSLEIDLSLLDIFVHFEIRIFLISLSGTCILIAELR